MLGLIGECYDALLSEPPWDNGTNLQQETLSIPAHFPTHTQMLHKTVFSPRACTASGVFFFFFFF